MWLLYAVAVEGRLSLLVSNAVGLFIHLGVSMLFWYFGKNRWQVFGVYMAVIAYIGASVIITFVFCSPASDVALGYIANVTVVLLFGSPLWSIRNVIKTKDPSFMPLALSVCSAICASVWCVYGILVEDPFIWIPSVASTGLALLQLIVKLWYQLMGSKEADNEVQGGKDRRDILETLSEDDRMSEI